MRVAPRIPIVAPAVPPGSSARLEVKASTTVPALSVHAEAGPRSAKFSLTGAVVAPQHYAGTTSITVGRTTYSVTGSASKPLVGARAIAEALQAEIIRKSKGAVQPKVRQVSDTLGSNTWVLEVPLARAKPTPAPLEVKAATTVSALSVSTSHPNARTTRVSLLGAVVAPQHYAGTTTVTIGRTKYSVTSDGQSPPIGARAVAEALQREIVRKSGGEIRPKLRQVEDAVGSNTWVLDFTERTTQR